MLVLLHIDIGVLKARCPISGVGFLINPMRSIIRGLFTSDDFTLGVAPRLIVVVSWRTGY